MVDRYLVGDSFSKVFIVSFSRAIMVESSLVIASAKSCWRYVNNVRSVLTLKIQTRKLLLRYIDKISIDRFPVGDES